MFINLPILPLRHSVVWGEAKEKRYAGMIIAGDAEIVMCTGIERVRQLPEVALGLISGYGIPICPTYPLLFNKR